MNPAVIGSTNRQTATQLAEAAIERMGRARKYGVGMDAAGRIILALPDDFPPGELLMVMTRAGDPDELADNIRHELEQRNGYGNRK